MARQTLEEDKNFDQIPFRIHPRVFAALGADLVTNDVVAVIELVKNSYDAFAQNVWLRFGENPREGKYLEIEDDGNGMTAEVIRDVWCFVATPYKELHPFAKKDGKKRRVAGEKGLGRLSAARLGQRLQLLTKAVRNPCLEVTVDWGIVSEGDDLSTSFAQYRDYPQPSPFRKSGTRLRIYGLVEEWDENRIADLKENLARLISPFSDVNDFNIFLSAPDSIQVEEVRIESPQFLSNPKYSVRGNVDGHGNVKGTYRFLPLTKDHAIRENKVELDWYRIFEMIQDNTKFAYRDDRSNCGPFSFEIRAWDIDIQETREIAERFDFQRSQVRKYIRAHKGISIYRDGILVLPKSDNARDWLGLDLRRVSKVGTRLSTSQVVGYVSISAEENPGIEDTSDRERLASRIEVAEFEEILKAIVGILENERDRDRIKPDREKPMEDLFNRLSAEDLIPEIETAIEEGSDVSETLALLRKFNNQLESTRKTIQERFLYYSRLATVGTIAHMLVHEIRNRTIVFGNFLEFIRNKFDPLQDHILQEEIHFANSAVEALEGLADRFAPLASRNFRRRKRQSVLEDQIRECLALQRAAITKTHTKCIVPDSKTRVAVDPGELDAIILNLITNTLYWIGDSPEDQRKLEFGFETVEKGARVRVNVQDTGPGIDREDMEKVFWPGVTRKPAGIGMGLTVASELVAAYGGSMYTRYSDKKRGASFFFDLPLQNHHDR